MSTSFKLITLIIWGVEMSEYVSCPCLVVLVRLHSYRTLFCIKKDQVKHLCAVRGEVWEAGRVGSIKSGRTCSNKLE